MTLRGDLVQGLRPWRVSPRISTDSKGERPPRAETRARDTCILTGNNSPLQTFCCATGGAHNGVTRSWSARRDVAARFFMISERRTAAQSTRGSFKAWQSAPLSHRGPRSAKASNEPPL